MRKKYTAKEKDEVLNALYCDPPVFINPDPAIIDILCGDGYAQMEYYDNGHTRILNITDKGKGFVRIGWLHRGSQTEAEKTLYRCRHNSHGIRHRYRYRRHANNTTEKMRNTSVKTERQTSKRKRLITLRLKLSSFSILYLSSSSVRLSSFESGHS